MVQNQVLITWLRTETVKPEALEDILFSNGKDTFAGWYEFGKFYKLNITGDPADQIKNVIYWCYMPKPKPEADNV